MGMYAAIGGKDFSLRGLLATACTAVGAVPVHGELVLDKPTAKAVLAQMVKSFEQGRQLSEGSEINGQSIYRLLGDSEALTALFDWVCHSEDNDVIIFA